MAQRTDVLVVRTLAGKRFLVPVRETVGGVMGEIEAAQGIPAAAQRLLFEGRQLDMPGQPLEALGIRSGATIVLVVKIIPAQPPAASAAGSASSDGGAAGGGAGGGELLAVGARTVDADSGGDGAAATQVTVLMAARRFQVSFSPRSTVAELKDTIEKCVGVPVASQRLIFAGSVLADAERLADRRVEAGTVLHLAIAKPA
jgi:hypothetical protein